MKAFRWLRWCLPVALFVLLDLGCSASLLPSPAGKCNPAVELPLGQRSKWTGLVSKPDSYAWGCLRVQWGDRTAAQTRAQLVRINGAGNMFRQDELKTPIFSLPPSAGQLFFDVFVFGLKQQEDSESIPRETKCTPGKQASYICDNDPNKLCWFSLQFAADTGSVDLRQCSFSGPDVGPLEGTDDAGADEPLPDGQCNPKPSIPSQLYSFRANQNDSGMVMTTDKTGALYIAGSFTGEMPLGSNIICSLSLGKENIFVAKLASDGMLLWSKCAGGTGVDTVSGIVLDAAGNVYIAGSYENSFVTSKGSTPLLSNGSSDVFVASLNNRGNWRWAIGAGGAGADVAHGIAISPTNEIFVTGFVGGGAQFGTTTLKDRKQLFVAKLVPPQLPNSQHAWEWVLSTSRFLSSTSHGIALKGDGDVFVTGQLEGGGFFGPIEVQPQGSRVFVARMNKMGQWVWVTLISNAGISAGLGKSIAVDDALNVYVTGWFSGVLKFGQVLMRSKGSDDLFVVKLGAGGNVLWSKSAGSAKDERGFGIVPDGNGGAFVTGYVAPGTTFGDCELCLPNRSPNTIVPFVARVADPGKWEGCYTSEQLESGIGFGITLSKTGLLYSLGDFLSSDIGRKKPFVKSEGRDLFVWRLRP